jgi:hypothetical protein
MASNPMKSKVALLGWIAGWAWALVAGGGGLLRLCARGSWPRRACNVDNLAAEPVADQPSVTFAEIRAARAGLPSTSAEEILAWRDEERR